jgi:hypothetical protein
VVLAVEEELHSNNRHKDWQLEEVVGKSTEVVLCSVHLGYLAGRSRNLLLQLVRFVVVVTCSSSPITSAKLHCRVDRPSLRDQVQRLRQEVVGIVVVVHIEVAVEHISRRELEDMGLVHMSELKVERMWGLGGYMQELGSALREERAQLQSSVRDLGIR